MRRCLYIFLFTILVIGCKDDDSPDGSQEFDIANIIEQNKGRTTIKQGVAGTVYLKSGNCSPKPGGNNSCNFEFGERIVEVYKPFYEDSISLLTYPYFDTVYNDLAGVVFSTAETGFYEIYLEPGQYSIFIKDGDRLYSNYSDTSRIVGPVLIKEDSVSYVNLVLDFSF